MQLDDTMNMMTQKDRERLYKRSLNIIDKNLIEGLQWHIDIWEIKDAFEKILVGNL